MSRDNDSFLDKVDDAGKALVALYIVILAIPFGLTWFIAGWIAVVLPFKFVVGVTFLIGCVITTKWSIEHKMYPFLLSSVFLLFYGFDLILNPGDVERVFNGSPNPVDHMFNDMMRDREKFLQAIGLIKKIKR